MKWMRGVGTRWVWNLVMSMLKRSNTLSEEIQWACGNLGNALACSGQYVADSSLTKGSWLMQATSVTATWKTVTSVTAT